MTLLLDVAPADGHGSATAPDRFGVDSQQNDTWEWDGNAWTKRDVSQAPEARSAPALATLGGKPVLFGGGLLGKVFDQTWEWNGSAWSERNVAGPSSRGSAAMAAGIGSLVLFGGITVEGSQYGYLDEGLEHSSGARPRARGWNASERRLTMEFHYYDGGHTGTDAARVETTRLLTAIVGEGRPWCGDRATDAARRGRSESRGPTSFPRSTPSSSACETYAMSGSY